MPSAVDKIRLTRKQDRRAKFSDKQVNEMKKMYANGYSQKAIAELYEVSQSTVCYIVSEKAHQHLAEYRKINPPKRRTSEESRLYAKNLRSYKKSLIAKGGAE